MSDRLRETRSQTGDRARVRTQTIELQIVNRMVRRGLLLAPPIAIALAAWRGSEYAVSGLVGIGMTLANLYFAGRVIGAVAESNPKMLLPAAMLAFTMGLALLTAISFVLKANDLIYFPVTGFTLIGTHLLLVLWESAVSYRMVPRTDPNASSRS